MINEDFEIVGLDEGVLRSVAEEIVGMANDVLIQWSRGRDEDGTGTSTAATCAAGALPCGGDGSGIAGHDHGVERAYIDAQLHRGSAYHATDAPVAQPAFDFTAFGGKIAAAITAKGVRFAGWLWIGLAKIGQDEFRVQAGIGEHHGLQIVLEEFLRDSRRFIDVAAADA